MKAFQPHEIHRTRETDVAFNTTNRFLADTQSELAALLKTLGWQELAERLTSYDTSHSSDPRRRSEIERDLCEALDFLSDAPFNPDSSWEREWSDFDAALRPFCFLRCAQLPKHCPEGRRKLDAHRILWLHGPNRRDISPTPLKDHSVSTQPFRGAL